MTADWERIVGAVADALAEHDYPGGPDEVERPLRLEQARAALAAMLELGDGERPPPLVTADGQVAEALRLLETVVDADGTPPLRAEDDETRAWRVQTLQVAEIRARLAHALTAGALAAPRAQEGDAPGLAALENLSAAMDRLAGAVERVSHRGAILTQQRG